MIVIQRKRQAAEYRIPEGGEILWYGLAAAVPPSFVIDSFCSNVFIRGAAAGAASNTPAGENSHTHTNPAATGTEANHTHAIGGGGTGLSTATSTVFSSGSLDYAPAHSHDIPAGTSGAGGAHSHSLGGAAVADAYPPYKRLYWLKAIRETGLPVGGIIMWDNPIAGKPNGTILCDGAGGTPDLRDNFIYGAAADADLSASGGAATHAHANAATGTAGAHSHTLHLDTAAAPSGGSISGYTAGEQVSAGGHTHGLNATSDADASHTHAVGNTAAGTSLPPYLKLYFIMRSA